MNPFGNFYSQYYDLLYSNKDYAGEVEYINSLINMYTDNAHTILDIGCGTGKHAEIFTEKGYEVLGVDISSDMLTVAEKRRIGKEQRLTFCQSDIAHLNLNKKFDVITALFHVMSYQKDNHTLLLSFKNVTEHLKEGGIFIFDFWYGPAVLTDPPTVRIKRLENESSQFIRIAEPIMHFHENAVEVNYTILIIDKETGRLYETKEIHNMRYFFDPELELICYNYGLKIMGKFKWLTTNKPGHKDWYVVWIVRK